MRESLTSDPEAVTFDHLSPDIAGAPFWDAIRELQRHGPLARVKSNGGFWAATSHEMVVQIAQDWETFSSADGVVYPGRPSPDVMPYIMPIDIDPPRHTAYRKQVNVCLTPAAVSVHEDDIRVIADELIDQFIERGECDIVAEFARKFPGTVFFRLIVRCSDDDFRSLEPAARVVSFGSDQEERARASAELRAWAARVLDSRASPLGPNDVVHVIRHLSDAGVPFADHEFHSGLAILAMGGIGTSASAIAAAMRILSENRQLQDRVRSDPTLVPALVEETLRIEPPIPLMFRRVRHDVELGGRQLKRGDWVGLFYGAANRDPAVFERPDEVDIDRPHYRHLTFSAGPHRCIGSNLARLQIRIALQRLISRLGPFRVPFGAQLEYASHQARGLMSMPLEFRGPTV